MGVRLHAATWRLGHLDTWTSTIDGALTTAGRSAGRALAMNGKLPCDFTHPE
jgi:hypothetical protein